MKYFNRHNNYHQVQRMLRRLDARIEHIKKSYPSYKQAPTAVRCEYAALMQEKEALSKRRL